MSTTSQAIFLSYASQDAEPAQRICDALRGAGVQVWFDQSALRGGDAWDASIRKQVKECALFVPIISSNTQAREEGYFRREWNMAAQRTLDMADDRAFLLPVVVDATSDVLARVPEKFREVQWTRLSAGEASVSFVEHVIRLLSGRAAPAPPVVPPPAPETALAGSAPGHEPRSIAVLPFVNRSHDEEDEYFSDGLADELHNVLTKIPGLRVAARSSAFTFRGKSATVAEVGRALNVATVLEGSVRKSGNRMRISVQLVKVSDGYDLWSETYDRTLEDIFAVQDDIAQSVVKELHIMLLGKAGDAMPRFEVKAQVAAAAKGRTTNPEAHRLFLQGRYFIDRNTREDAKRGISLLQEALALDPAFALAWAALGGAYAVVAAKWDSSPENFGRAREAVARALALEPDLADGHEEMGWIQIFHDLDWRGAEVSLRRALELAPGNARVLRRSAQLEATLGRLDGAIALVRRALEQDPLSNAAYHNLGRYLDASGRHADAEAAHRKALDIAPQQLITRANLALNLLAQGRGDEALVEAAREPDESFRLSALAIIEHAADHRAESDTALRELIAKSETAYLVALVHSARGDADLAFDWLERAYDQREGGLAEMKYEPYLRSLHADPRWDPLLRKMGLATR